MYTVRRPVATDCNRFSNGFRIFLNQANWQPQLIPNQVTATNSPVAISSVQFGFGYFSGCINRTFKGFVPVTKIWT
jgi:hypothetical protein